MSEELVFLPIRELAALIRTRQVSPVELAETFLDRLETLGPRYNAVVTVTRDRALEQARRAESEIAAGEYRGLLHGVPYGAKDLLATSGGIPTTWGAAPYRGQVFEFDATVVRKLEEAGAVLVAKLAMVELAGGMGYRNADAAFTGPGINPWNTGAWAGRLFERVRLCCRRWSGPVCHRFGDVGLDPLPIRLLRSLWHEAHIRPRQPLRRDGAELDARQAGADGPYVADDCGIVLEAIAGHDPNDASTSERTYTYESEADGRRLKAGRVHRRVGKRGGIRRPELRRRP